MRDDDLVRFLQWALPRMGLRWEGFRKPRRQVGKRIVGRLEELGLAGLEECLRSKFRRAVRFAAHDVRTVPPRGPFDVVLCRNLAFTYFAEGVQRAVLEALRGTLRPGGWLVSGGHEELPEAAGWEAMDGTPSQLRRRD